MIKLTKYNNIYLRVHADFSIHKELKDYFSVFIKNHWFHPKVKSGAWDGRVSYYKMQDHLLPTGLFPDFLRFCDKHQHEFQINFPLTELKTTITEKQLHNYYKILFKDSEFYPRDYQHEAIYNSLKKKRGVLLSPTGSGKSLILYVTIRVLLGLKKNVLLIVPTTTLVEQMYTDFEEYDWNDISDSVCRLYGGKKYDDTKPILISTWQSVYKKDISFFDRFGGLLIDECLHPKTQITMADGSTKDIKNIEVGDMVKSYNSELEIMEDKEVMKVHKNLLKSEQESCYNIESDVGDIYFLDGITGNHEVITENGKIRVDSLVEGDELIGIEENNGI